MQPWRLEVIPGLGFSLDPCLVTQDCIKFTSIPIYTYTYTYIQTYTYTYTDKGGLLVLFFFFKFKVRGVFLRPRKTTSKLGRLGKPPLNLGG